MIISDLADERDSLELTLTNFAVELKARVGGLRIELNRVKRQVAEYRRRIERLRESDLLDPEQVEREVAEEFAEQAEQERLAEEQAAREGQRIDVERPRPQLDAETEAEILRLYRELAKRFHPDRARTEKERDRRTDLMLQINVAYSERDLVTLQAMAREADTGEPRRPCSPRRARAVGAPGSHPHEHADFGADRADRDAPAKRDVPDVAIA